MTRDEGYVPATEGNPPAAPTTMPDYDDSYAAWCAEQERLCGRSLTLGASADPYGVTCDKDRGHAGLHAGPDPISEDPDQRVCWSGGGTCAGDPLPVRNVRFGTAEEVG